jgi:hypothetical protein
MTTRAGGRNDNRLARTLAQSTVGKNLMRRSFSLHECRDMLADGWSHLESVARTAANEPHVFELRVAIDEKVSIVDASYWQTRVSTNGALAMSGKRSRRIVRARAIPSVLGTRSRVVGSTSGPAVSSAIFSPRRSYDGIP